MLPDVSPAACASRSIWPVKALTTTLVAMPLEAVALPRPVAVPTPPVFAKATEVVLSEATVLPAASSIVAVSVWLSPDAAEPDSLS